MTTMIRRRRRRMMRRAGGFMLMMMCLIFVSTCERPSSSSSESSKSSLRGPEDPSKDRRFSSCFIFSKIFFVAICNGHNKTLIYSTTIIKQSINFYHPNQIYKSNKTTTIIIMKRSLTILVPRSRARLKEILQGKDWTKDYIIYTVFFFSSHTCLFSKILSN